MPIHSPSYKRYLFILGLIFTVAITTYASIVYIVDPYGFYRPLDRDLFPVKPAMPKNQNMAKSNIIKSLKPTTVYIGSSRIDYALTLTTGTHAYNAGLKGIRTTDLAFMIKHSVYNGAQTIIWGLDFFTFNTNLPKRNDFNTERLTLTKEPPSSYGDWKTLISLSSLKPTIQTILYRNRSDVSSVTVNGQTTGADLDKKNLKKGMESMFTEDAMLYLKRLYFPVPNRTFDFGQNFKSFDQSLAFLEQNNIQTTLFIPPVHVYLYTLMYQSGLYPQYEQWKHRIIKIAKKHGLPIHDYSAINMITTEKIPSKTGETMTYWWEGSHFKPILGDRILATLDNTQTLNHKTIKGFKRNLIKFQCDHPEMVQTIRQHIKHAELENRLIHWPNCQ